MYHFCMFIFNYCLDRHIIKVSKSVSLLACESQIKCGSACRYSQGKLVQYNSGAHVLWRLTIFAKSPQITIICWVITSFRTFISTPVTDLMRAIRTSLPINRSSSSRCRRLSSIARLCFSSFRCLPYSMMLAHVMKHRVQLWTLPLVNKVESLFTWNNCVPG